MSKKQLIAPPPSYIAAWLDPYFHEDRYHKSMRPKFELVVRNLNRPNDERDHDPNRITILR